MKNNFVILILFSFSHFLQGQNIDMSAVEHYFKMTDSLKKNIPLSKNSWQSFLTMKGLELYVNNQGFDEAYMESYRQSMEIVYMPKNDSLLKIQLKDPENYFLTHIINQYKVHEEPFKAYTKTIIDNNSQYLKDVYETSYAMLPKRMHKKAEKSTFYFIPIFSDALAEDNDVVITLYCAYFMDKIKKGAALGHEIHHVIRKNKTITSEVDSALYAVLTLILHEGSADLIDKQLTEKPECPDELKYSEYILSLSEGMVGKLDTAILNHINKSSVISKKKIRTIAPMSGHVPGYFMALVIDRNGFREDLIKAIDDPIQFVLLYNKAAKLDKSKPYVLSEISINYLKKLKQKKA
jgi:hypothetical protein